MKKSLSKYGKSAFSHTSTLTLVPCLLSSSKVKFLTAFPPCLQYLPLISQHHLQTGNNISLFMGIYPIERRLVQTILVHHCDVRVCRP